MPPLYPLLLLPALHPRPWGGRALASALNKPLPDDRPYGESWEMHDSARIAHGALAGRTVGEALADFGSALGGAGNDPAEGLPLLVKFLDANEWLSIQDHPNDEQARELEGEPRGKNEAWYVLAAAPDARLVIGVQPGLARDDIAEAIRASALEDKVVYAQVEAGDVLYMAAGTIHALGPGLLVYEIQQSSDITYRLYDWGRLGLDGKPRDLHIDKGLRVASLDVLPAIHKTAHERGLAVEVVRSPYFYTNLYQLNAANGRVVALDTGGTRFHGLTCIGGTGAVEWDGEPVAFAHGQTLLIPAALGAYRLTTEDETRVLLSAQPG
jgi:mannose-6-phosphate isomerase